MLWSAWFRAAYRVIRWFDPVLRFLWRRGFPSLRSVVDVAVVGRRTGARRSTLVTLLSVDGNWYVGHPNGAAAWTRNLADAGRATLTFADGRSTSVAAVPMFGGPEREAAIRATWSQQPFPANVVYALARRHVRRVGVYCRLNPLDSGTA